MQDRLLTLYLFKIYGKTLIKSQRPYKINLVKGYWVIIGSLPKDVSGGYFEFIINAKNEKVVATAHGK